MVPIDSPGMVSYSTFIDTIVVSVTVIEIFSIKAVKLSCVAHFQNGARKVGGLNCAVEASRFSIRCPIVSRRTVDSVILWLQSALVTVSDISSHTR